MSDRVDRVEPELAALLRRVFHGIAVHCRTHQEADARAMAETWQRQMLEFQKPGLAHAFADIAGSIQVEQSAEARRQALLMLVAMSQQAQGLRWRPERVPEAPSQTQGM